MGSAHSCKILQSYQNQHSRENLPMPDSYKLCMMLANLVQALLGLARLSSKSYKIMQDSEDSGKIL